MNVLAVGLVIATLFLSGCSTEVAKKAHETRRQMEQAAAHRAPKPEDPWVHVYASAIEQELSQGVLIIMEEKNGFVAPGDAEVYQTPAKAGTLSLRGAEGLMLTAKASDGSVWLFDLSARQFRSYQ